MVATMSSFWVYVGSAQRHPAEPRSADQELISHCGLRVDEADHWLRAKILHASADKMTHVFSDLDTVVDTGAVDVWPLLVQ